MRFLAAAATIGGLTMISRIAGFIRDLLMASVIGAGAVADAFFVALKLPNLFRRISAEGAFNVAFVPLFSQKLEGEGREVALQMARVIMGVMTAVLGLFTLVAIAFMPGMVAVIAPGFVDDPERFAKAVELARLTFPYLLFISLASLIGGVMNVMGRFALYAFLPVLFNLCLICALLFYGVFGVEPVVALAIGVSVSGALQLVWMFVAACLNGAVLVPSMPRLTGSVRRVWVLMVPAIIGAGVMHINIIADMIMASFLGAGSVSHLYYADRLNQLPLGVIGVAIGTALLPMLSGAFNKDDLGQARHLYNQAVLYAFMIAVPCSVALLAAAPFFIQILFQHGAFTADDTAVTSAVLRAYALGLPAYVLGKILQTACFAQQDTRTPVRISIIVTGINIALSLILIQFIGVVGIALSTAVAGWLQLLMLGVMIRRKGHVGLNAQMPRRLFALGLSALLMGAGVYWMAQQMHFMADMGIAQRGLACIGVVLTGGMVYACGLKFIARVNVTTVMKDIKG